MRHERFRRAFSWASVACLTGLTTPVQANVECIGDPGDPSVVEHDTRRRPVRSCDSASYSPIPLLEDTETGGLGRLKPVGPEEAAVTFDLGTGQETVRQARIEGREPRIEDSQPGGPGTGFGRPIQGGRDHGARGSRNFSDLELVDDTTSGRYPTHVRLERTSGGRCSGTLIDSRHVITAGHCIHEGDGGDWYEDVLAAPAYDRGSEPYGDAGLLGLLSWKGWTDDGSRNYDLGVVYLDRPVGALTGWRGYGYHNKCKYFKSGNWVQNGYPGDPYDGQRMYTRSGDFDHCQKFGFWWGHHVSFDKRGYRGLSGAGTVR